MIFQHKDTTWEQRKVLDLLELLTDYDANGSFAVWQKILIQQTAMVMLGM